MSTIANMKAGIAASRDARTASRQMTCTRCAWTGEPEVKAPGRMSMEIALWLVFFPVGILYSIWRLFSKRAVCGDCGATEFVPASTKAAKVIRARFES